MEKSQENSRTSLASVLKEAQNIIEAAEKRAADLNNSSLQNFEENKKKGFQEGYQQGLKEASETAVRMIKNSSQINHELADQAARLAIDICSKIISEQITVNPDVVKTIAKKALLQSVLGEKVIFVTNPDDKEILMAEKNLLSKIAGNVNIFFESDSEISRGGCIVKTDFGEVDALIPSLIEGIADYLGIRGK